MVRFRFVVWFLSLLSMFQLSGCAHAPGKVRVGREAPRLRHANPVALHHVFRGALYEVLGDARSALIEYQEALLYDSTSSSLYQAVAENYLRLHKVASAVKMLQRAIALDSTNAEALRLLADLYQRSRRYDRTEWVLKKLIRIDPDDPDVLGNLVALLVGRGDPDRAIEVIDWVGRRRQIGIDEYLELAQMFAERGAADQAKTLLYRAVRQQPKDERPYMGLADMFIEQGDTAKAQLFLEEAIRQHPDFVQVRRRLHDVYIMQGEWNSAIELLEEEVRRDSGQVQLWLQLGRLYIQQGDTARGERLFRELTARFPKEPAVYVSLAAVHLARRDTAAAIEDLRAGLREGWSEELVERTKDLLVRQGRLEEALSLFEEWVARDTTNVAARLELADLHLSAGDTTRAEEILQRAVKAFPKDWRPYFALGRLYYIRSEWAPALKFLRTSRELEDGFAGTWILSGLIYLRLDSLEDAEQVFGEAVRRFPNDAQLNFLLGNTLNRAKRTEEALPYLEKAVELEPDDLDFLLGLAAAYDELRDFERSDSLYRRALKLQPDHPTALNNYAYSLSVRGERLEEAYEMAQKALEAQPRNGAFLDTMGWILYKMGRYDEALEYIRKAAELRSDSAEVFEHLGDVYEKLGEMEQARNAWRKALDLDSSRQHLSEKIGE